MFGVGVNDFEEVFERLAKFKQQLATLSTSRQVPKMYFATADIRHCYDTIDQDYLFNLVRQNVLKEDVYFAQRYSVLHPYQSLNKIQTKNTVMQTSQADWQDFMERATNDHANHYNNAVIVDKVYQSLKKKEDILALLREHIFSHFVVASSGRGRDTYLKQNEGIAQGSVLSMILCNMYVGRSLASERAMRRRSNTP